MPKTVAIIFGGASSEHRESIKAARILYDQAIEYRLKNRYKFAYFYLSTDNQWASAYDSQRIIKGKSYHGLGSYSYNRLFDFQYVDVIYNTMMGTSGENGNIMGLADLLGIPMIGCPILASAVALDKHLSKVLVASLDIPVVNYLLVEKYRSLEEILPQISQQIKYPCFVKPTNMGTCSFVFKASDAGEFAKEWKKVIKKNYRSHQYLIETFIPNTEIRVFLYEDIKGHLIANDEYVTELKESALEEGGGLFLHRDNEFPPSLRKTVKSYAKQIFRLFNMKDYARIDFFIEKDTHQIYFNEANTQPFIGSYNIQLMAKDGLSYVEFLDTMIQKNLRDK